MNEDLAITDLKKAHFGLDILGDRLFDGYTDGRLWNGWACPYFERHVGNQLVQAMIESGQDAAYRPDEDLFWFASDEKETATTYGAIEVGGIGKLYGIGAAEWCWEEVDHAEAPAVPSSAETML